MNSKSDHSSDMCADEPSSELFDSEESTLSHISRTVYSSKDEKLIQKYFSSYIADSAVLIGKRRRSDFKSLSRTRGNKKNILLKV